MTVNLMQGDCLKLLGRVADQLVQRQLVLGEISSVWNQIKNALQLLRSELIKPSNQHLLTQNNWNKSLNQLDYTHVQVYYNKCKEEVIPMSKKKKRKQKELNSTKLNRQTSIINLITAIVNLIIMIYNLTRHQLNKLKGGLRPLLQCTKLGGILK